MKKLPSVFICREETNMIPDRSILDSKEKQVKKLAEKVMTTLGYIHCKIESEIYKHRRHLKS